MAPTVPTVPALDIVQYSFEAEALAAALCRPPSSTHCSSIPCVELRSSMPATPPVRLMRSLLAQPGKLTQLGFRRLEAELLAAGYVGMPDGEQRALLQQLGVNTYRGDGVSGLLPYFCDRSGTSCAACKSVRDSLQLVIRAQEKGAKLEMLCDTASSSDVHAAFGKQALNTMTGVELLYKVRHHCSYGHAFVNVRMVMCACACAMHVVYMQLQV